MSDIKLLADLKALRKRKHVSICAMGRELGIHRNTMTRIERGASPSLEHALLIADYFQRPVTAIWWVDPRTGPRLVEFMGQQLKAIATLNVRDRC